MNHPDYSRYWDVPKDVRMKRGGEDDEPDTYDQPDEAYDE